MTNKEMLIQALQNYEGEYESCVTDYIDCPNVDHCLAFDKSDTRKNYEKCSECKREWLLKEAENE